MLIGELARRTGASVRSLRHYENEGLIEAERLGNGYREFGEEMVERVKRIRGLLANGFTVEDVRPFVPCMDRDLSDHGVCREAIASYEEKIAEIDARIGELEELRSRVVQRVMVMRAHREATDAA